MEQIFNYLVSESGLLGVLLAASVMANVYLYRRGEKVNDERLTEAREDRTKMVVSLDNSTKSLEQNTEVLLNLSGRLRGNN